MENKITSISDIRSNKEGKMLLTALAVLTTSPKITINGETIDGTMISTDEMVDILNDARLKEMPYTKPIRPGSSLA